MPRWHRGPGFVENPVLDVPEEGTNGAGNRMILEANRQDRAALG